jgi:hypothetical protein
MNKYIDGTIMEMLERLKTLKVKIPVNTLPDTFKQLAAISLSELDNNIIELERLQKDPKYQVSSNLPFKLNSLQKLISGIDYLENFIISSLNRYTGEDERLTKLVDRICKEIKYPLLSPVASGLSQNYYCFHPKFNLLTVPLLESEFLLHLPDLYHELAHQLISTKNHPTILPFQTKLGQFNLSILEYFEEQKKELMRNNGIDRIKYVDFFTESWIQGWSIELFCDLFGVYTLGLAFAWAHLHLCVKRGINPYETLSSHPADDARMQTILFGLENIGFKDESKIVSTYWEKYLKISGGISESNFKLAFPHQMLKNCASLSYEGIKEIKCQVVSKSVKSEINSILNESWDRFINNPNDFIVWEKGTRERFKV